VNHEAPAGAPIDSVGSGVGAKQNDMKLMQAIVEANHRALAGDPQAGLHPTDFAESLPLVALSCIDVRLNSLLPQVLGVPAEQFIWLRNAGNIITSPVSSTMRSLALACAVKGGRELVIIGHTECVVGKLTTMELIERFRALGIDRQSLPENLNDYFGTFASERANVIKAADLVRSSPLISPSMAVHGLLVDIDSGKLDWLVDGYQALGRAGSRPVGHRGPLEQGFEAAGFSMGDMTFPSGQIGDAATRPGAVSLPPPPSTVPPLDAAWAEHVDIVPPGSSKPVAVAGSVKVPPLPPKIPLPPPAKRRVYFRR